MEARCVEVSGIDVDDAVVTVGDLIALYNNAFSLIRQFADESEQDETLQGGLDNFLQFYGFSNIFEGLTYDERGLLDQLKLMQNLESLGKSDDVYFVGQALSELLFFQIFAARPWLSDPQHQQLQEVFNELAQLITG